MSFKVPVATHQGSFDPLEFESEQEWVVVVAKAKQMGQWVDPCGRSWTYLNADKYVKSELYCAEIRASIPLFEITQKPIDPLIKFR